MRGIPIRLLLSIRYSDGKCKFPEINLPRLFIWDRLDTSCVEDQNSVFCCNRSLFEVRQERQFVVIPLNGTKFFYSGGIAYENIDAFGWRDIFGGGLRGFRR